MSEEEGAPQDCGRVGGSIQSQKGALFYQHWRTLAPIIKLGLQLSVADAVRFVTDRPDVG